MAASSVRCEFLRVASISASSEKLSNRLPETAACSIQRNGDHTLRRVHRLRNLVEVVAFDVAKNEHLRPGRAQLSKCSREAFPQFCSRILTIRPVLLMDQCTAVQGLLT